MALSGTYIKSIVNISETETELKTITYPVDMIEGDANYELRGTTVEVEVPLETTVTESLENVYLIVTGATIEKQFNGFHLGYAYRVFNSRENNNTIHPLLDDYLYSFTEVLELPEELPVNPIEAAYEDLKTKPSCANMINA